MVTYTARWVFPVSGPPVERGVVAVDGERIVVARGTADVDLGEVAIIPGLVNAHTHLDLSGARGLIPPTDPEHFTDWLMGVIAYRRSRTPEQVQADIAEGLAECLKGGTTLVGDIASGGYSWSTVAGTPLRGVVFFEMLGLNAERLGASLKSFEAWANSTTDTALCRRGVSPHAPYSVSRNLFRIAHKFPFTTAIHLAEFPGETDLLTRRDGPLKSFLQNVGAWEPDELSESHVKLIEQLSASTRTLFVHGNELTGREEFNSRQSLALCPRTHAAFRHPRHPFAEFLARGVNVALGTDSLASNPDLDLFEEARFLFEHRKDVSGETILQMATLNGAKALGFEGDCGSLEPAKSADFVVMPLGSSSDPYEALFTGHGPRRTLFRGNWRD